MKDFRLYRTLLIFIALLPSISHAEDWFSPTGKYLTGDWAGERTALSQMGYDFTFDYSAMAASNIAGGYRTDTTARYSDQYTFGTKLDLEKIAGISNAQFVFSLNTRNGRDITVDRIQDSRAPVVGSGAQSNYGRGETWHIGQLWYKQQLFDNSLDIKLGRMAIGEDFDNNGCYFQNLSLCGSLAGHGSGVWYNAPVSQYGGRIRINFNKSYYAQFGAFLHNPSYLTRRGSFKMNLSGRTGNMYIGEFGYLTIMGADKLPGSYKVGGWYNSAEAADLLNDSNGNAYLISHNPARIHNGRYGGYLYFMQQVSTVGNDVNRGLSLFLHLAVNDKDTATVDYQAQFGAIFKGPFSSRMKDYISFGVSKMHINQRLTHRAGIANSLKGVYDYDDPAYQPGRSAEYAAELRYSAKVTPWFTFNPNIQLIANPGGVSEIKDAWVIGTQAILSF
ncbi:carbohydrate porin [Mixta mediterraneensis]|uniref:carbohydrate porin n=1 Tax=Mixta mediterraneensis TaxID=2758443 RepID=UPI00187541BE|nr:carbohydrate porin [Mixta mediterraneensis]MBE5251397.1 carbohydrate porin [Mixta mediterraneensis]